MVDLVNKYDRGLYRYLYIYTFKSVYIFTVRLNEFLQKDNGR